MADDETEDGRPTFQEVVQAMTPPGTNWEKFKEAEAHLGRSPLRRRPDIQLDAISAAQPERAPESMPADPFASLTQGAIAATAMHETFRDLMAGGFTEDQALTFLARAFAARQQEGRSDG